MAQYNLQGSDEIVNASIDTECHDAHGLTSSNADLSPGIEEDSVTGNVSEVDEEGSEAGDGTNYEARNVLTYHYQDYDEDDEESQGELKDPDAEDSDEDDEDDEDDGAISPAADPVFDLQLFPQFSRLYPELKLMILEKALEPVIPRTISISIAKSKSGKTIYTAEYIPDHPYMESCEEARNVLKTKQGYVTLSPKSSAGSEQKDIWIQPKHDTVYFHESFFGAWSIDDFLSTLTYEERCNIHEIEYVYNDQSYLDSGELPSIDGLMLLQLPRLKCITFLEDRENRRDMRTEPGRVGQMEHALENLGDGEDWNAPGAVFMLQYGERRR